METCEKAVVLLLTVVRLLLRVSMELVLVAVLLVRVRLPAKILLLMAAISRLRVYSMEQELVAVMDLHVAISLLQVARSRPSAGMWVLALVLAIVAKWEIF